MPSTATTTNSTDPPFTNIRRKHAMVRDLLDITPGGSSVHLHPMTDKPDPDRDQLVTKMVGFWNHFLQSNPAWQDYKKLRAENQEKRGRLDKELEDVDVGVSGRNGKSSDEGLVMIVRQRELLEKKVELLVEEYRFAEQANKEAVEALKEEMRQWRMGPVISYQVFNEMPYETVSSWSMHLQDWLKPLRQRDYVQLDMEVLKWWKVNEKGIQALIKLHI